MHVYKEDYEITFEEGTYLFTGTIEFVREYSKGDYEVPEWDEYKVRSIDIESCVQIGDKEEIYDKSKRVLKSIQKFIGEMVAEEILESGELY